VIDQVNADGTIFVQSAGYLELGADAINAGDQNWLLETLKLK
jgi:hypothetical protein